MTQRLVSFITREGIATTSKALASTLALVLLGTFATGCAGQDEAVGNDSNNTAALQSQQGEPQEEGQGKQGEQQEGKDDQVQPGVCAGDLTPAAFEFPRDEQSCEGPSFLRWSSEQNLWVGVVSCEDGAVRVYLAESEQGPFLPALDTAGHGQDHCELLAPGFTLGNEDDIASGSCSSCSTGLNLPIEGLPGYARSQLGEPFVFVAETSPWSYQTSRLHCGCALPSAASQPVCGLFRGGMSEGDHMIASPNPPESVEDSDEACLAYCDQSGWQAGDVCARSGVVLKTYAQSGVCAGDLMPAAFEFPRDEQSCEGPSFLRWSSEQNLWVGVVSCEDGAVRVYLAESEQGPFLPALDTAGHGQDHCELLAPGFTLGNEDDITSGSCSSCSTGLNLPIEGLPGYARSQLGEPFVFVAETSSWSYQTSRLHCGCALEAPASAP